MLRLQRRKVTTLLAGGITLTAIGRCLPEEYFALSARNIAVAVADGIIATTFVIPLFEALDLPTDPTGNGGNGNDGGTDTTTDTTANGT
ncbi:MAG: hypothetical protein HY763_00230 [Planctomycetes bacterium]|nr:hypothetical protein [Planctomycetota bacterium]